jgi:chitodextrinase
MKARVAVGVFLAFLPLLAFAQSTTAEQLLQALLPPNTVVPKITAPISTTVVVPPVASSQASTATPSASKATLLQSLYAELQTLEAEIAALEAAANQHCTPLNFTRNLALGSSGTDVTQLQQFLVAQGDLNATPTGYFGTLTQAAVIQFQKANNISAVGSVGPITRAKITALSNSCTTEGGGSSTTPPPPPSSTPTPPTSTSTSTAPGTPTTIVNYTPPAGGGGGGGGGSSGGGSNPPPPPPPNYGSGIFAQFFQNGTLSIPTGSAPSAAPQVNVNSLLSYAIAGVNGNDSMLLPAGTVIQNSTNGASIDITTLNTQDIASTSLSGFTTETPVAVLQWGTPSIPLSFTQPITLSIAVDPGFNGDTLDIYDSESQTGPWVPTGLATPTCLITNGLCQFQTTSASFFAAAKRKATVTIAANPTTVSYGNSTTITWSSTNATSCTASNGWSGSQATSGTQTFTNLTTNETYTLTCKNRANSATQSASVTVTGSAPDTTPPSAPTNLSGTATSPTQINLTWTASSDNVGVTGYNIYRAGTLIGTSTLTSFSNTGLTASTQYTYTVKAFDAAGNISTASNSINVTTQTPPAPTVTISANPTSVTSGNSSTLTWSSTNATSCTASGAWSGSEAVSGTQSLTNLTATSTYTLSCTGAGGNTNQSTTIGVTTLDTTPPSVTITAPSTNLAAGTTQTTLAVTTNENATCAYSTNAGAAFASMTTFTSTGGTSHSTTLSPLSNGTTYTYYVKCKDTSGNISGNASVTFAVAAPVDSTPPSVPTNLSATAVSSSAINLTWSASTDNVGVTGYNIYRNNTQIGTSPTNSYSDTGLTASTQYTYTVSAYDAAGNVSAQSGSASATTEGSGGGSYVGFLDTYSSLGATWGFSPYKLTNAYAGSWGSIERQSDGATTAIGFLSNGTVDVSTFNSFCANTNCYVTTLNDQVNGINATQTTFSKMPRVFVDSNGVLAVCPQPGSTMTTQYNAAVNTPKQHLFAVAQLNYSDNRWSQSTTPGFSVTGNVTSGSATVTNLSNEVGISTANDGGVGQLPGVTDSSGFLPTAAYLSAFPSGTNATIGFAPGNQSPTASKTGDILTFRNAVLSGAWIVNGPPSSTYYSSAYWGAGVGADGSPSSWSAPRNGSIGYMSSFQNVLDEGMRGQWAVYDYDTNTTQLDYDGISLGNFDGTLSNITYSTNTGMTLFSDTNGNEGTSNTCFETMALFPNTESSRVPMAQSLMTQDNISSLSAPMTSDGFTMTGEYLPSYTSASNGALGSYSVGPDAHGMTWNPQSGGYSWPSLAYANNVNNGGTMWRFIDEQGDSDMNITGAERTEIAESNVTATPGKSFSFSYQFDFEQLPNETGDWCYSGQLHYNNVTAGADAPDIVNFSCKGDQAQFQTQKTSSGNPVTTNCGPAFTITPGTTYAVVGTGFWSSNHTSDTLTIDAGPNGGTLSQICSVGPSALWDNDTGAYLKAGLYRGYPWSNAGTAILRVMNPQFTATANAFSSYITTQPALPTNSGSSTPAPTATLSASPTSITSGNSSTLTWSSTNASSCTGTGFSASGISGSTNVSPTVTTNYSITCTGTGGTSSPASATVTVTTGSDTTPPSTPTNLAATAVSSSAINLTWTASTDNVGVTGYKIFRGGTQVGTSASNSYSDTGLTASTQYTYTVSAYDAAGNNSAQSSSASATTQASGGGGGGGTSCSQATSFLARVSVDANHQTAYTNLICGLVTDGVWSKLDVLYMLATQNSATALTNLTNGTYQASLTGSPAFTTDQGFGGSSAANYISFGWAGSNGPNYTQTAASYGGWSRDAGSFCGAFLGTSELTTGRMYLRFGCGSVENGISGVINHEVWASNAGDTTTSDASGFWALDRSGSTSQFYHNGLTYDAANTVSFSDAPSTNPFRTDADANSTTQGIAVFYGGGDLTSAQHLALYNRIHAYMQAIAGLP